MKALHILDIVAGIVIALLTIGVAALYALFDGEKLKGLFGT